MNKWKLARENWRQQTCESDPNGSSPGSGSKCCEGGDRRRAQARLAVQQAKLARQRSHVSLRRKERSAVCERERER